MVDPRIQLSKSKLFVDNHELVKTSGKGKVVARHGLRTIRDVRVVKTFEPFNVIFAAILLGVVVVAKAYIPLVVLSWVVCVLSALGAVFLLASPFKNQILIESADGEARYDVVETSEEVGGFVLSLLEQARELQSATPQEHSTSSDVADS